MSNRLTMTDPTGTTAYTYDALDRLSRVTWPDGRFIAYTYDAAGSRATMTNPAGQTTTYAYDGANRLATITDPTGTTTFGYDAAGNRTALTLSNGASTTYTYNANNWLLSLLNKDRSGATTSQFTYSYDPNGNRTQIMDQSGASAFAYDARNQLTQASYPDGRSVAYIYDGMGNRTQMVVTGPAGEGEPVGTTTYSYDAASRLLQRVAPDGATTFAYDQNGNLLTYAEPSGTRTFGYAPWNRMTSVTSGAVTVTYTYDGQGQKVRRQGPSGAQRYYYDYFADVPRILAEADAGSGTFQTIYQRDIFGNLLSDGTTWHQSEGLGSIVSRTNSSGALAGSTLYGAWGTVRSQSGTQGKWGFTGAEWDPDARGYHIGARWYDPVLGRWRNEDPRQDAYFRPQTLNFYAYGFNSPNNLVDRNGREACAGLTIDSYSGGGPGGNCGTGGPRIVQVTYDPVGYVQMAANNYGRGALILGIGTAGLGGTILLVFGNSPSVKLAAVGAGIIVVILASPLLEIPDSQKILEGWTIITVKTVYVDADGTVTVVTTYIVLDAAGNVVGQTTPAPHRYQGCVPGAAVQPPACPGYI